MQEKIVTIKIIDMDSSEHIIEVSNSMSGYQLKTYIYQKLSQSLTQHQMKLVYAGAQIQNNQRLNTFNLAVGNIITFQQQKIDLSQVSKIVSVNEEDHFTGETILAKMPCGHSMGRDSMVVFIRSLISQKKYQILCPNKDQNDASCLLQWEWKLCRKIGVFTSNERQTFQIGLSQNWIKNFGKECPSCKNIVSKGNLQINRVKCPSCKFGDFCYMCLEPWKGKDNNFCGSSTCVFLNEFLEKAPWTRIFKLKDKKINQTIEVKTPKYRICPNCRISIEQYEKCKHTKCLGCQKSFCWVCLSIFKTNWECGDPGDYCGKVAQIQKI